MRTALTAFALSVTAAGAALTTAAPASAGGVGDFLSPAFGTSCANDHSARVEGTTTHDTGAANGNLAGLPVGSPLNQCGGADMPDVCSTAQSAASAAQGLIPLNPNVNTPQCGNAGLGILGLVD
ncbi:hypothetical protein ACLGIH_33075 [Streptomyces sp. HMX87]|uniref:hypothetical protein n=1 Tax=Streptomyces sp. HMX87 TaxID=3390849 RepID=UPI003A876419